MALAQEAPFADGLPEPNKYMPTLDSVRGIAIAAVMIFHGLGPVYSRYYGILSPVERGVLYACNFGFLGVHLFFVLSGFLISGILLDTRNNSNYYRNFYERRVLRILPAFLLVAIVLKLLGMIGWLYFFLSLFFVANLGSRATQGANFTGFWTLSVEEQFYLVWPTLVRRLSPRHLFYIAVGLIVVTPAIRFGVGSLHAPFNDMRFKVWDNLDFFGAGAALALLVRSRRSRPHLRRLFVGLLAVAAIEFAIHTVVATHLGDRPPVGTTAALLVELTVFPQWVMVFSAAVLGAFLRPDLAKSVVGRGLAFLGYISYGLYLMHGIFQKQLERRWDTDLDVGHHLMLHVLARFFLWSTASILVAWLSRTTFEAYFLHRKPRTKKVLHDPQIAS